MIGGSSVEDMKNEKFVRTTLRQLGAAQTYRGFDYTIDGALLILEDKNRLKYITKTLYPDIAQKHNTSWYCVERDIRTIVDVIWNNGDKEMLLCMSGEALEEKPNNAKFLKILSEYAAKMNQNQLCGGYENCCGKSFNKVNCGGENCEKLTGAKRQVKQLEEENKKLKETIGWMYRMIWDLVKRLKDNR